MLATLVICLVCKWNFCLGSDTIDSTVEWLLAWFPCIFHDWVKHWYYLLTLQDQRFIFQVNCLCFYLQKLQVTALQKITGACTYKITGDCIYKNYRCIYLQKILMIALVKTTGDCTCKNYRCLHFYKFNVNALVKITGAFTYNNYKWLNF